MTKKFKDLNDKDLAKFDVYSSADFGVLIDEYKSLRDHHIEETTTLYAKLTAAREETSRLRMLVEENVVKALVETVMTTKVDFSAPRACSQCDGHCPLGQCYNRPG